MGQKGRNNIPGHCYVIEGEVVEERFAGDGGKLGGEVHQLSLWIVDWPRFNSASTNFRDFQENLTLPLTRSGSS